MSKKPAAQKTRFDYWNALVDGFRKGPLTPAQIAQRVGGRKLSSTLWNLEQFGYKFDRQKEGGKVVRVALIDESNAKPIVAKRAAKKVTEPKVAKAPKAKAAPKAKSAPGGGTVVKPANAKPAPKTAKVEVNDLEPIGESTGLVDQDFDNSSIDDVISSFKFDSVE